MSDSFLEVILVSNISGNGLNEPLALDKEVCLVNDINKLKGRSACLVVGVLSGAAGVAMLAIGDGTVAR